MDNYSEEYRKEQEKRGPLRADKIIFLICLLSSCAIGVFFQKHLNSRKCSSKSRHYFSFSVGFLMLLLCYGIRCGHLLVLSSVVYVLLNVLSPKRAFRISFIFSMFYLTWAHLYRMKIDYGGYSADVSLAGTPRRVTSSPR
uniref:Lysophospholipid acyltransferase 2 n=1 Tax=Mesocestoides corti TaxID=53468 RepID=A0A5K3EWQ8_MESCO